MGDLFLLGRKILGIFNFVSPISKGTIRGVVDWRNVIKLLCS